VVALRCDSDLEGGGRAEKLKHRSRLRAAVVAAVVMMVAGSCSTGPSRSAAESQPGQGSGVIPLTTARQLPSGTFYVLAGPAPISYNLWEVSNAGLERQLTHNRPGYGISTFGASSAGIVLADAASGVDELSVMTAHGPHMLGDVHAGGPVISSTGLIAYAEPPLPPAAPGYSVDVESLRGGRATTLYAQARPLGVVGWGPDGALLLFSNPDPIGPGAGAAGLLVVSRSGHVSRVQTGPGSVDFAVWGEHAPAIAVYLADRRTELVRPGKPPVDLPAGWLPQSWSPSGNDLLMATDPTGGGPAEVGLWQSDQPGAITPLGPAPSGSFDIVWLAAPAPLASAG
jgi:hypothetical protein